MSQQDLLDRITKEPGILQKNIVRCGGGGDDVRMILQLLKKKCITRKATGHTYELYATGELL